MIPGQPIMNRTAPIEPRPLMWRVLQPNLLIIGHDRIVPMTPIIYWTIVIVKALLVARFACWKKYVESPSRNSRTMPEWPMSNKLSPYVEDQLRVRCTSADFSFKWHYCIVSSMLQLGFYWRQSNAGGPCVPPRGVLFASATMATRGLELRR
jgi:hypothetical protein